MGKGLDMFRALKAQQSLLDIARAVPIPPSSPLAAPAEAPAQGPLYTERDLEAIRALFLPMCSGAAYLAQPTPQHDVWVLREGGRWAAWAGWHPWRHAEEEGPRVPAKEWDLYQGPDFRRALRAAAVFAAGATRWQKPPRRGRGPA